MTFSLSTDFDRYYVPFFIGYIGSRALTAIQYLAIQKGSIPPCSDSTISGIAVLDRNRDFERIFIFRLLGEVFDSLRGNCDRCSSASHR